MLLLFLGPVGAVALAWTLTSRYREHRPTALLLSLLFGGNLARHALDVAVLAPLRAELGLEHPWTGWAWGASLASHAISLAEPAALIGTALVVFVGRTAWLGAVSWLAMVAAYAAIHPLGHDQLLFHAIAESVGALVAVGLAVGWWRRPSQEGALAAQHAVTVIVMAELVALPNVVTGAPIPGWPSSETLFQLMFATLIVMQAYVLRVEVERCKRRQDIAEKGVLRSNLFAESAMRTAERAEEKALEARDLVDVPALRPNRKTTPA